MGKQSSLQELKSHEPSKEKKTPNILIFLFQLNNIKIYKLFFFC